MMMDVIERVLVDEETLQARVQRLGAAISADYESSNLILICVLKGGVVFLTDLMRHITVPNSIDFMAVSSYGVGARRSTGDVRITLDLKTDIRGKDVIIALAGLYPNDVLNQCVEFTGPGVGSLTMDARMSIANMTTEWGALVGWFPVDDVTLRYMDRVHAILAERGIVDPDHYERENERFYREYKEGRLDIYEFLRFSLAPLARHSPDELSVWRQAFLAEKIEPIILPKARALVERHRAAGMGQGLGRHELVGGAAHEGLHRRARGEARCPSGGQYVVRAGVIVPHGHGCVVPQEEGAHVPDAPQPLHRVFHHELHVLRAEVVRKIDRFADIFYPRQIFFNRVNKKPAKGSESFSFRGFVHIAHLCRVGTEIFHAQIVAYRVHVVMRRVVKKIDGSG